VSGTSESHAMSSARQSCAMLMMMSPYGALSLISIDEAGAKFA